MFLSIYIMILCFLLSLHKPLLLNLMTTIVHCSKGVHFTAEYVFFFWVRPPPFKHPVWLWLFPKGYMNMRKAYFPALATSHSQSKTCAVPILQWWILTNGKIGGNHRLSKSRRHFPLPHCASLTGINSRVESTFFKSIPRGPVRWFLPIKKVPFSDMFTQQALVTVTTCLPVKLVIPINLAIISK